MSESIVSSSVPALPQSLSSRTAIWAVAVVLVLSCLGFHMFAPLGPDVSWLLTVSERMLDGQALYVDIMEPNPPMAGLLYILPVGLARLLAIPAEPLVVLFTTAFGLATTMLAARVIKTTGLAARVDLFVLLSILLAVVAWGEDFAQREHFATMAAVPVIVAIAARAAGHRLPLALWLPIGLAGGLLLAIKPHFALAMLLPLIYAIWKRGSAAPLLSAELWIAGLAILGFLAMTWVWFPGFFSTVLPAANAVYVPDRRSLPVLLLGIPSAMVFEVTLLVALIVFRKAILARPLHATLFLASVGFALVYVAQGKGFPYHIAPAQVMLSLALVGALIERGDAARSRSDMLIALAAAGVLAVLPMVNAVKVRQIWEGEAAVLRPYGEGLRIANLTTDLAATSPLHRMVRGELVNSAPSLLMTLSALRVRQALEVDATWSAAISAVERAERDRLKEDFLLRRPDVLLVSDYSLAWLNWAKRDPDLSPLIEGYRDIGEVEFVGGPVRMLIRAGLEASPAN